MKIDVVVPRNLRLANEIVAKEVISAMRDSTILVQSQVVSFTPHITSTLARSVHAQPPIPLGRSIKGIVSISAVYAPYVNDGTGLYGPHKQLIKPKTAKALRWKGDGGFIFARSTKGQKGQHFKERGYAASKERVEDRFNDAIKNAVKEMSQ